MMLALRGLLGACAVGLGIVTYGVLSQATPTDAMWWCAAMIAGGGWCAWALAWDWTGRRMGRRPWRRRYEWSD